MRRQKNQFLADALKGATKFSYRNLRIVHRLEQTENDLWFLLRLASRHDTEIDTKDFRQERVENWPNVVVVFNNDPSVQKIAVSENRRAFTNSDVVIHAVVSTLNEILKQSQMVLVVEPIFEQYVFWDIVERYRGRILQVSFDLISPNMANISGGLMIDLAALNQDTNTHRTRLEINSEEQSALELNERSKLLKSIVTYAADGAGNISLRIRGMKKRVSTRTQTREVTIDEIEVEKINLEALKSIKELLEQ